MIITTTGNVEGFDVTDYRGIVFGEVITGINILKDLGAGLRNIFGGVRHSFTWRVAKSDEGVYRARRVNSNRRRRIWTS